MPFSFLQPGFWERRRDTEKITHALPDIKSDVEVSSCELSSAMSPRLQLYHVESPSRESHREDSEKFSSHLTSPASSSPLVSPSHHSSGRSSRDSSASRFSSITLSSAARRPFGRRRYWSDYETIMEEGDEDDRYASQLFDKWSPCFLGVLGFLAVFAVFCLILWASSRPLKAEISLKSLTIHSFYYGEGADRTGVPTKILTMDCSTIMAVHNPARFFGIHVSVITVRLLYSGITVAKTQLDTYYQPRGSYRNLSMNLQGIGVPLYGAGITFAVSDNDGSIPLTLVSEVQTVGYVLGKLVTSNHKWNISCSFTFESKSNNNNPIKFMDNSCIYN